ncbi:MAG: GPW/gp25 family protein [Chitinophagaceae bacterium]
MDDKKSFLGTGWSFPPTFSKNPCRLEMVSDEEDIAESLKILLSTRHGERVMQPEYGCNLDVLLFEPVNTSLLTFVKDLIEKAILYHEPRIDLRNINISTEQMTEGLLLIELEYVIRQTNSRYNLVYPFYLKESEQQHQ